MLLYPPMDSAFHQACSREGEGMKCLESTAAGPIVHAGMCARSDRQELR